jgi:glycosyltransferase involved in cell wall biosynthesis
LPILTSDQLRQYSPPAKNNLNLRIVDSHEFVDLYRGDKDLRIGKLLCENYGSEFIQLGSDAPSPADSLFFKTNKYSIERVGHLPDSYYLLLLKSRVIFHRRGNVSLGGFFRWSSSISREVMRWRPDLIFEVPNLTLSPRSYMTHQAARRLGVPLVYLDCGDIIPHLSFKHKVSAIFEKPVVNSAAALITYNEAGKKRFMAKYDYSEKKILVIPKPVDTRKFRPDVDCREFRAKYGLNGKFVVAYFGRICENKGAHYLLDVASIMRRRHTDKDVVFLFVGGNIDPAHAEYFQNKLRGLLLDNVKMTGRIFHENMPPAYAAADLAVFPDITNIPGFSTVLAESMAAGVPSILGIKGWEDATPIRDGVNGVITEPRNIFELADRIEQLKNKAEFRKTLGANAFKFAREEMDYNIVVAKYHELFCKLTGKINVRSSKNEYRAIPV